MRAILDFLLDVYFNLEAICAICIREKEILDWSVHPFEYSFNEAVMYRVRPHLQKHCKHPMWARQAVYQFGFVFCEECNKELT